MIASFYPFQVADDPNFPNKICSKCLDRTINSYLFTQQCERAERALRNCFNDLNEKFDKLDPLERVKRRGRQKLHPNHNVLYADYKMVMGYADPIINIINVGASREEEEEMEIKEFGKHLRHIEKHKFKNVLEHLIEKRMDDFCGVCMDKGDGSQMVELNETFHLHAGYPELTGERTLARVLKETVPEMNTVNNYIGTKICETCLNHALTCYIFLKKIRYTRTRLDTCIALMLKNLNGVEEPDTNVIVEIAEDSILPLMTKDEVVDDVEFDDSDDTFEGSMNVEVLEDEFRIESESSDDSVRSLRTYGPSAKPKNTKIFDDLKKNLYPVNPTAEFILHNPAKDATRTYVNKKLVNGIQPKLTATHEVKKPPPRDVCSEFLTFKKKPKPARRRWPRFTCPLCSKHFISDYFLKKHVLKHVEMKTKCPLCSARLKSKFCLFEHMKMVHIAHGVPYSVCTVCCRGFADASKLASHKKTHHGKECQLCGKRFSSQKRFDVHLQRHAVRFNALKGRKAQTCSFCEKECSNENELSLHVNKSHLQIKPYSCDMCDKQFYTEHNLASHKRVHTFLSREKCEFCDKVFKCRKDLVVHVRRHIGSKPHHCHVCRQSFYSETGRNVHMRKTHGGRFCCRLCKSVFNRKLDLKAHVNVAHNAM
ncbi:unnamed protein product, partial [Iphiclides podalirius]